MKKSILLLSALAVSMASMAQKAKIFTAKEYLRDEDYKKAVETINEAVNSESTKANPEAWFTRGLIYSKVAEKNPADAEAVKESTQSYIKVLEVDPKYDPETIDPLLLNIAIKNYNAGSVAYNDQHFDQAFDNFKMVVDIRQLNNGKHFAANKRFDTIAAQALKYQAMSAYHGGKETEAAELLQKAKKNPAMKDPTVYAVLIDLFNKQKNDAEVVKTIDEAKALFPKSPEIQRREINYYSSTGKNDILVKKLEESVAKDPNDPTLQYMLGVTYNNLANPVDADGKPLPRPANAEEMQKKAEEAYKYAIDSDPNKAEYSYNLAAMYFNNAALVTAKMNEITGTSAADNKKYDALKASRNELFMKSLPHFQKAYDLLNANAGSLKGEDVITYEETLKALQNIYSVMGQNEKASEMGKKLEEMNK